MTRRRFGSVRRLPSGRYQAAYVELDGQRRPAPATFSSEAEARRWLEKVEKDLLSGRRRPSGASRVTVRAYCEYYLGENPNIGPRWAETCRRNMRLHLAPLLDEPLASLTTADIRRWYGRARTMGGATSVSQTYRMLHAVLAMAVDDEVIAKNPARIPGAGYQRAAERPIATPAQVDALIEATSPHLKAAVALAAWCGLRRGEICALRRSDVNLEEGTVTVTKALAELLESAVKYEKAPKSAAGVRTVAIPPHVIPLLDEHLRRWAGVEHLFESKTGLPLTGNALYQGFVRARKRVGVDLTFHDLRHTGQSLAAAAGANLADLKRRLGHSSSAAAIRYLHPLDGRDHAIATALSTLAAQDNPAALPQTVRG